MRVYGGEELKNLARRLYEAGFNIVPVLRKRPLLSWGSRRRAGWGEIEKALGRADGLALVIATLFLRFHHLHRQGLPAPHRQDCNSIS